MFYGAQDITFEKARELRENRTLCEKLLWNRLKKNQLGVRFKPQHPIAIFVVDFYCHALRFVIEVDGVYHNFNSEYDQSRSDELEKYDLTIIRFTNDDVLKNIDTVVASIQAMIETLKQRKKII
jgi:very-short-patch-repair endonuclease